MTAGPLLLLALTPEQHLLVREAVCSWVHLLEDRLTDAAPGELTARAGELAAARQALDALSHRRALPPGPPPAGRVWLPAWSGPWMSDCGGCGRQHRGESPEQAAERSAGCGC